MFFSSDVASTTEHDLTSFGEREDHPIRAGVLFAVITFFAHVSRAIVELNALQGVGRPARFEPQQLEHSIETFETIHVTPLLYAPSHCPTNTAEPLGTFDEHQSHRRE